MKVQITQLPNDADGKAAIAIQFIDANVPYFTGYQSSPENVALVKSKLESLNAQELIAFKHTLKIVSGAGVSVSAHLDRYVESLKAEEFTKEEMELGNFIHEKLVLHRDSDDQNSSVARDILRYLGERPESVSTNSSNSPDQSEGINEVEEILSLFFPNLKLVGVSLVRI
jgi:hypothetical protein